MSNTGQVGRFFTRGGGFVVAVNPELFLIGEYGRRYEEHDGCANDSVGKSRHS
jgi:hypothetical protein